MRSKFNPCVGEGWRRKCNPLQGSCLGNPVDRGAWRATVHGVTQSRTRLSGQASTTGKTEDEPGAERHQEALNEQKARGLQGAPETPEKSSQSNGIKSALLDCNPTYEIDAYESIMT